MYTNTRQQHKSMATYGTLDAKTLLKVIEEEHRQEIQRMQQQLSAECAKRQEAEAINFTQNYTVSDLERRNQTLSDKIGSYTKVNKELSLRVKTSKKEKEELRQEVESLVRLIARKTAEGRVSFGKLREEVKCLKAQIEVYEAAYGPLSPTLIGRGEMDMDIDDGNREIQESDYYFAYNFASSPSSYTYSSS